MSIRGSIVTNTIDSYADAFRAREITSSAMKQAINDWFELYFAKQRTEKEDPCQQIPLTVVRKLTKAMFSEYAVNTKDAFAQAVADGLDKKKLEAVQMAMIGGESYLKPIPTADGFRFTVVHRANVLVFGRRDDGTVSDIGTAENTSDSRYYYTLLERRTVDERGYLTIRNLLYRSDSLGVIGSRVSLKALPQYADLPEEYTYPQRMDSVGLAPVKIPMANCVDGSTDGISVYAPAAGLIHNINRNEAQLCAEFERGESRIIASADLMDKNDRGQLEFRDNIFVGLDENPADLGVTIFSPELREQSYLNRKQEYLRNVENVIGLKRGLLSDVEAAERTAKEITSTEGEYNLTVIDLQKMWEETVREAVRLCGILGQMYRVPGAHAVAEDAVTIDWGNGVLYDEEKTWADYQKMVSAGLLKPEIAVGWRFNMPTDTPAQLDAVRKKYMPDAVTEEDE